MSTLYIDRKNIELKGDGDALAFYENGVREGTVPLVPVSRIFLRGDIKLSSGLLGKLGERGIGVVVLSGRKATPTLLLGRPHNDAARRVAQYRLSLDPEYCLGFSRAIVAAKLTSQLDFLKERREQFPIGRFPLTTGIHKLENALEAIDAQESIASLRGLEGTAAASYFEALREIIPAKLHFLNRNRRPPRDPVNAILSLTYTMLHCEAVLALYGAGLDPFIGFYHTLDFGRESLACDVMEALRPQADRFALALFREETLVAADFSCSEMGCLLGKTGRARYYAAYEKLAEVLRKELESAVSDVLEAIGEDELPKTFEDVEENFEEEALE
jgi:CRISPR-associated protein Cas1